ncbi:MAG: hypothetical protein PHE17_18530 [Thiothrix sp.]|uniref:hypothetical protein n=1 Tax=Thiothrix sp. TaxID=1032 RepID=UPI00262B3E34|nr:hypothetical protein [Thiothrix sp.]MDD5394843.1 hypothetical protein [Thiothrix sp.]MDD5395020.1 hypothetical protein [Thiothrix sp.]
MNHQYRAAVAQDGNFKRLFVFNRDGVSTNTVLGGLLNYQPDQPLWTTEAVGKCDLSGTSIVDVGRAVLVFGSHVFQCNMEILEDWDANSLIGRDDFIVSYLDTLWRMLPDSAITESQYFLVQGGEA